MSDKYTPFGMDQKYSTQAHEYFDEVLVKTKHDTESLKKLRTRYTELHKYKHTDFKKHLDRRDGAMRLVDLKIRELEKKKEIFESKIFTILMVVLSIVLTLASQNFSS